MIQEKKAICVYQCLINIYTKFYLPTVFQLRYYGPFTLNIKRFNVDFMMLYISGRDHARKLKFSSYVYSTSVNKLF